MRIPIAIPGAIVIITGAVVTVVAGNVVTAVVPPPETAVVPPVVRDVQDSVGQIVFRTSLCTKISGGSGTWAHELVS